MAAVKKAARAGQPRTHAGTPLSSEYEEALAAEAEAGFDPAGFTRRRARAAVTVRGSGPFHPAGRPAR